MKYIVVLFLITTTLTSVFGQTLKGAVVNKKGNPISGAEIVNTRIGNHAHSDEKGNFIIESVKKGDTLKISHVSYVSINHVITQLSKPITIVLQSKLVALDEVVISRKINALTAISDVDLQITPVKSSQEILRQIPGLFIGQHAGGGKAEQIFLRGFDIDHGTDIAITADGIPVNMVSHAHGQGYSDLHFIIPETIDKIDFGKGTYYADKGDFNTAGYVDFQTKKSLDDSKMSMEIGQFNTYRFLGMFNVINTIKNKGYIAAEYIDTDGPFKSPQNFNRFNIFGKYMGLINASDNFGITVSHFKSTWDASGQIPQRAIDSGLITRFGSIDDTEGGTTGRTNLLIDYNKRISENEYLTNKIYYSQYDFELYSNFTFFLKDPVNGDQIKQKESRNLFGFSSTYKHNFGLKELKGNWRLGLAMRKDQSNNNELSRTRNRQEVLNRLQSGDIDQTNIGGFGDVTLNYRKWTLNAALRGDYFDFQYNDELKENYLTQSRKKITLSPKLNVLYNIYEDFQFYAKTGKGFHSNDARVVIPNKGKKILPAAYGYDLGFIWKPFDKLLVNTAYWYLFLEQEFVYVGDEGVVEPSGKTSRQGAELSIRYQPLQWLFTNVDANYTFARSIEEEKGQDYIPLAPDFTLKGGINTVFESGLYAGLQMRYMDDRPANEDNSIIAKGYSVFDFNMGYNWKHISASIQIQNLFDTQWNETQFATESRLLNEPNPVEEIHFTPGTPFNSTLKISYTF